MSEKYKLKYEVLAILRENIIAGMTAFGIPVSNRPGDGGWIVMESDQHSIRNADKAVLLWMEKVERIGWQGHKDGGYNAEKNVFESKDFFLEQQTWKIKVLCPQKTTPVTPENIPICTEDVAGMLIAWFSRPGCQFFVEHGMSNLFVLSKDIKTYKDTSDVPQWVTEFPLKIHVNKEFTYDIPAATIENKGLVPIRT